ncbi:ubiquinol-cytochrome c reductase iron-sulfur subunit [Robiginitalea sp. SC105]|uniref:QcrA and Rieske domain-containing protein n=1 Tax=Robiginitalea sp. SC105 TaxID=2762332 RepID=UPI00163A3542|nr:Rieske 2Fe-2S domain-containing protein [Robiginitalea sp. SC105]MBC2839877.1 Rieske 2Fe-2S domain-containing protein [Robiginitalea sp. SC105]
MERKEFLRTLGAGAAFAVVFPCVQGCTKGPDLQTEPIPTGVDFTIDLSGPDGDALANNGDFIVRDFVVIARNLSGVFVAASRVCSHQQTPEVSFVASQGGIFQCSTHGSQFAQDGTPINNITTNPLKIFQTELNGDLLRIFE